MSSLALNLTVIVGSTLAMNGLIFGLGWGSGSDARRAGGVTPPGWVIGVVWTVLFALLALARWQLAGPNRSAERAWVTGLILFCLAYPVYAIAPDSKAAGFGGNLATLALAGYVAWRVRPASRRAAWCVLPVVPWVTFATVASVIDWGWLS